VAEEAGGAIERGHWSNTRPEDAGRGQCRRHRLEVITRKKSKKEGEEDQTACQRGFCGRCYGFREMKSEARHRGRQVSLIKRQDPNESGGDDEKKKREEASKKGPLDSSILGRKTQPSTNSQKKYRRPENRRKVIQSRKKMYSGEKLEKKVMRKSITYRAYKSLSACWGTVLKKMDERRSLNLWAGMPGNVSTHRTTGSCTGGKTSQLEREVELNV